MMDSVKRELSKGKIEWRWLREGELKKETEGLIMAAQTQSLRTNVMKAQIDKALPNRHVEFVNRQKRR